MTGNRLLPTRQSLVLGTFALVIACGLAIINHFTQPAIETNKLAFLDKQLSEVLPAGLHSNQLQDNPLRITDPVTSTTRTVYIARDDQSAVAAIITATAPDGYSGAIDLLVGILPNGELSGVRVVEHSETPGLGDDIELSKSDWILQFDSKSLNLPINWAVQRDGGDFDQLTGATITPRAIVYEVQRTLQFFKAHQQQIFTR